MRQRLVVRSAISKLRRIFSGRDGERRFIRGVAFAEDNQTHIVREQAIKQRHEQIESLFRDEARHHSENRSCGRGREREPVEQQVAADRFPFEVTRVRTVGNKWSVSGFQRS